MGDNTLEFDFGSQGHIDLDLTALSSVWPEQRQSHACGFSRALHSIRSDREPERLVIFLKQWRGLPVQIRSAVSFRHETDGDLFAEGSHLQVDRLWIRCVSSQHGQGPLGCCENHLLAFALSDLFACAIGDHQLLLCVRQVNRVEQLFASIHQLCREKVSEGSEGEGVCRAFA